MLTRRRPSPKPRRRPGRYVTNARAPRPTRLDPTRTATLRAEFRADLRRRYNAIRRAIIALVDGEDAFGLRETRPPNLAVRNEYGGSDQHDGGDHRRGHLYPRAESATLRLRTVPDPRRDLAGSWPVRGGPYNPGAARPQARHTQTAPPTGQETPRSAAPLVVNERWQFRTNAEKVQEFETWLRSQQEEQLGKLGPDATRDHVFRRYIERGYQKGAGRAFDDTRRTHAAADEQAAALGGAREEFLRSSFAHQETQAKLELLAGRTFTDLKGVNDAMATRMTRVLADGLVQGKNPRQIARTLAKECDISKRRAEVIARTEIARAHSEGQLDAFEKMGVEQLGVAAEWSTTGAGCPMCAPMEGVILKVSEARGLIPRHPSCLCSWVPAVADDDAKGLKRTRSAIEKALTRSVVAEGGAAKSRWIGADRTIASKRPGAAARKAGAKAARKPARAKTAAKTTIVPEVPKVAQPLDGGPLTARSTSRGGKPSPGSAPLTEDSLRRELRGIRDPGDDYGPTGFISYSHADRNAMRNLLDPHVTYEGPIRLHGMAQAEHLYSVEIDGVKYMWSASTENQALRDLHGLLVGDAALSQGAVRGANQRVIWAAGQSVDDAYWATKYNVPNMRSAATAGDGDIVVYFSETKAVPGIDPELPIRNLFPGTYHHETGHNFARKFWGQIDPPQNLADDYYYASQVEGPVSAYGAKAPMEDFAEAFRLYMVDPASLKANFPLKYQAIDDMVKARVGGPAAPVTATPISGSAKRATKKTPRKVARVADSGRVARAAERFRELEATGIGIDDFASEFPDLTAAEWKTLAREVGVKASSKAEARLGLGRRLSGTGSGTQGGATQTKVVDLAAERKAGLDDLLRARQASNEKRVLHVPENLFTARMEDVVSAIPAELERDYLEIVARAAAADSRGHIRTGDLYRELLKKHPDLTSQDFRTATASLYNQKKIRPSGWSGPLYEAPTPELMISHGDKPMEYIHPG